MRRRHASTLSSQLLPLFGLDPAIYRLRFDFSEVEALRENVDALHARWRETFVAGGIDLFTFQEKIGLAPDESLRGRFVKASSLVNKDEDGNEVKAKRDRDRDRDFDSAKHPRGQPANAGQFVSAGGNSGGRDATTDKHFNSDFKVEFEDQHKIDELSKALFGRETPLPAKDWGELAGAPDGSTVKVSYSEKYGGVELEVRHDELIDSSVAGATQTIYSSGTKIVSFYEWIAIKGKGGGIGQRMMIHSLEKGRQLGLSHMYLQAAGGPNDSLFKGYNAWARLGFNVPLDGKVKNQLPPNLREARSINDLMKTKEGQKWWMENGKSFYGTFSLKHDDYNGAKNNEVLQHFMKEKGIKI